MLEGQFSLNERLGHIFFILPLTCMMTALTHGTFVRQLFFWKGSLISSLNKREHSIDNV